METAWQAVVSLGQGFLVVFSAYALLVGLAGLQSRRQRFSPWFTSRFAVLIPAHNEAAVLDPLLANLQALRYPKDLYDIYVIADNCTDGTEAIAAARGVRVLRRRDPVRRGKGYALGDALSWLGLVDRGTGLPPSEPPPYDAVVILDADNLVSLDLLRVMDARLHAGQRLIQAYVDSKNPGDTWVSAAFSIGFWVNNRFNLLARSNLGLSAALMGTGMCIAADVLRELGWETESLTEDLEFSVQALCLGYRTAFAPETRVYDEKAQSFTASLRQRLRWARGQTQVALRYGPRLLRAAVLRRDVACLDGAARLLQMVAVGMGTVWALARPVVDGLSRLAGPLPGAGAAPELATLLAWLLTSTAAMMAPALLVWRLDRLPASAYRFVALFPLFTYTSALVILWGLLTHRRREWLPTRHTRRLSYQQVLQQTR
ncbi:glycosyl transferase family 2 [Limnochorda pilosa]|uniref:Glycosyl transferase family 2 n=1 Tax=Limnochorda pilosa TaxID=1555112 RepID=A0A0K2SGI4_LIMPI|nr:glycosyl transferase family 2 [Limnochorda pilosa]